MTSWREPRTWSPRQCPIAIVFLVIASSGCSGVAGAREHSSDRALATHCQEHVCGSEEHAEHLGDGCYVVHARDRDRLFECTTDIQPAGELMCLDVTPCSGACKVTISIDGREVPIDRCRPRWEQYRRSLHPLTCSPVGLRIFYEPAALALKTPLTMDLPARLVQDVLRTGKEKVVYAVELCVSATGIAVGERTHSTGFAEIDRLLRARIGELEIDARSASGSCAIANVVLGPFECDVEQSQL